MPDPRLERAIAELRELCENVLPGTTGHPSLEDINPIRDRIDAIDRLILVLFNERAVCANEIGRIKKQIGIPIYVPERELEVLENVTSANAGPLTDDAVKRLFERIIDETRSLERHKYQDESHL
jgi:chorismate mutase-like protein